MKANINSQKIEEALTRGVENIYPSHKALERVLRSGKKLRIYIGIDPTGKLHVGHMVVLRKLRQFQDLGHEIIILIGDFTATIGDPTDKAALRKPLTRKQVLENAKDYKKQIGKILDTKKPNIKFLNNEAWANKLKPADMLKLASCFTVARLLERDMFQKRIKDGKEIHLHEFLYPVFQAYDSVAMNVDLEIGGNDQSFNMLAGRDLIKKMKNKEKFVLATRLLTDSAGKKMGKTEGNLVSLDTPSGEMYGKIMSWPDSLIKVGFEILTDVPLDEVKNFLNKPREAKARLAREVVATCHSKEKALLAEKEFNRVFKEKELPTKIPEINIKDKNLNILDLLVKTKLVSSKSEARRLVLQKGIKIDNKIQDDWRKNVETKDGLIIQAGKRKFAKIKSI
ncbi:MAG: tyrosine--tRNA ligase [Candidatus Nealsonbacteria bacterium RBG_13_42_11]|uniref:Tyrosine--tRNA ligase n=1 Tax=Candidatus Nealsonbacteria bacterium RBG_13_42_11 TaxID=1801663 RepID=A0A1G2DZF3_9BACT|nr:MAG: tyrosine--tRNA ligase [Candidatus Nealsonbacteria bacterium RBG_13_42_11]